MSDTVPMRVYDNVLAELRLLEARLKREQDGAAYWRESWERLVGDIGDLLHRAKRRPKGRRFVTVLELDMLLTGQAEADHE